MWKKIPYFCLLSLVTSFVWTQGLSAKTWPRGSEIQADSIVAAIERGEWITIDSCEIFGQLIVTAGLPRKAYCIKDSIRIERSTFHDTVSIRYCNFLEWLVFFDVVFTKEVDLTGTTFSKEAMFFDCTFRERGLFPYCTFMGTAYFAFCTFDQDAGFRNVVFQGDVDFQSADLGRYSDFSNSKFGGTVRMTRTEFKDMTLSWGQLRNHIEYYPPANMKLMKYFEENRSLDDADGLYLFLKDQERKQKPPHRRYPEFWLIQQTCGYGVKPERVLVLSILIVVGFMFFYAQSNAITEIQERLRPLRRRRMLRRIHRTLRKRLYDALYFSFQTFIIGVVPDWRPTENCLISTRKVKLFKFRTLAMIEGALGWILLVLFVVTLTRKFIR